MQYNYKSCHTVTFKSALCHTMKYMLI